MLLLAGTVGVLGASHAAAATLKLDSAEFVLDDSPSPPPSSASWQPQALPDNWNVSRPNQGGNSWYRVHFELPRVPGELYAIYVRKLSMNAAFYANGTFLGSGGRFEEPVARQWNRPQFFTIPPELLKQGKNVLYVRLWAYPNSRGGLGAMQLGPEAKLRPEYERRYFVQTVLPQLCTILAVASGLLTFALWARRQAEPTYVPFFMWVLLWTLSSVNLFIETIPMPALHWDIVEKSAFGWGGLLCVVFTMRYLGMRRPRLEKLLAAYAALGPILMVIAGPAHVHPVANDWLFVILAVAILFEALLIAEARRQLKLEPALLASVLALGLVATIHDGLVHRDELAFERFYVVPYVWLPASLLIGWMLTNRFVRSLNVAEQLNLVLEQRVAQKHAELERHYECLQKMARASAIAEERQRMMTEMHDGVGSQLIATLDLVEQSETPKVEIARGLREVLDGLRLTIDSLEPAENDLLTVLGNLRYRLGNRLTRQGIALDWQVSDLPELPSLTPPNVLHILRILQEAFTNIAKHARAKAVTVRTGFTEQHLFVTIADDGCGFAADTREGRGLANMRRRAQSLGARLAITPSSGGTTLSLHVPRGCKGTTATGIGV